jgi:tetratricopeptide (TPR) repeat protein
MSRDGCLPGMPGAGRSSARWTQAAALAVACCALAAAWLAGRQIDARATQAAESVEPIFFPRAEILRPALLGFDTLAADLTWIRTVQYFGGRVERRENFPQLYQWVDMTTSLDRGFLDAYLLGGLFLVIARQFPQAIAIYEKGVAAKPGEWRLPHDLGRLYFLELRDYEKALRWWEAANRLPGRPEYLPRFLARLYAKTGGLETALELWQAMYDSSDNDWVRKTAKQELRKILTQLTPPSPQGIPPRKDGR